MVRKVNPLGALSSQYVLTLVCSQVTVMGILRQYNNEIIVGHNVGSHDSNSSLHSIKVTKSIECSYCNWSVHAQIYPASLGMSSVDFYSNKTDKHYLSYRKLIVQIANLLGASNQTLEKSVDEILDFESKLANVSSTYEKNGGGAYQRMPLNKLSKVVPRINWTRYFEYAIPIALNETESIGVYGFDYFLDLQDLIETTSQRLVVECL